MPSVLLGFQSGGSVIIPPGVNIYSGRLAPAHGVRFFNGIDSSGDAYIGVLDGLASGGITLNSGGVNVSGGWADAVALPPGQTVLLPRILCSGQLSNIVASSLPATSGRVRLSFWIE